MPYVRLGLNWQYRQSNVKMYIKIGWTQECEVQSAFVVPLNSTAPRSRVDFDSLNLATLTAIKACTRSPAIWQCSSALRKSVIAIANSLQCSSADRWPEGLIPGRQQRWYFLSSPPCRDRFWGPPPPPAVGYGSAVSGNEVTSNPDHLHPVIRGAQLGSAWPTHRSNVRRLQACGLCRHRNVRMQLRQRRGSLMENWKQTKSRSTLFCDAMPCTLIGTVHSVPDYTASYPTKSSLRGHRHENLKYHITANNTFLAPSNKVAQSVKLLGCIRRLSGWICFRYRVFDMTCSGHSQSV
jgi:hypothetical protein